MKLKITVDKFMQDGTGLLILSQNDYDEYMIKGLKDNPLLIREKENENKKTQPKEY